MKEENLRKIIALRHQLHQNAELSGRERKTKKILMDFMREHTDFEMHDCGSWFWCVREAKPSGRSPITFRADMDAPSGRSPIAFRADMDALPVDETLDLPYASTTPGVSHKCGHDGHSAALAGLGLELTGISLPRSVVLIFQPAEETGKGGEVCARLIPQLGISQVYAFHNLGGYPEGAIVVRDGLSQPASKGLTVHFQGKTSHASDPEEGKNPSDAIADLEIFTREALKDGSLPAGLAEDSPDPAPDRAVRLSFRGMVLCTIVNMSVGKKDFGVSPGQGEISMTLRAEEEKEMDTLEYAIRNRAEELAARDGLTVTFSVADPFPETRNDPQALERVIRCAGDLGFPVIRMQKLWRASEDFGYYQKQCPGAIFYVGNGTDYPPLHTCLYDFNDRILSRAADLFLALALFPDS